MNQFYPGKVVSRTEDGKFHIDYKDGDKETLNMEEQTWRRTTPVPCNDEIPHPAIESPTQSPVDNDTSSSTY